MVMARVLELELPDQKCALQPILTARMPRAVAENGLEQSVQLERQGCEIVPGPGEPAWGW